MVRIPHSKEKTRKSKCSFWFFGPSVEIRTRGLLNPIQARYQTSPHPDIFDCQGIIHHFLSDVKWFLKKFLFCTGKDIWRGFANGLSLEVFFDIADALEVNPADLINASVFPDQLLKKKSD